MTALPRQPLRVTLPPARPTMIYDGNCSFCIRQVQRMKGVTGEAIDYVPSQQLEGRFAEIPRWAFDQAVQLVETDGAVRSGAEAIVRALELARRKRALVWTYRRTPVIQNLADLGYRFVSAHRGGADRIDRLILEDPTDPRRSHTYVRALFLRGLGVVYLIAFLSLWVQIDGLCGSRGIVPQQQLMSLARASLADVSPAHRFFQLPTLCWINSSDAFLHFLCGGGVAVSCLLVLGILPAPALFLLWLCYLSLVSVAEPFLPFQWDQLLLEAGFLGIFFAPLSLRLRTRVFRAGSSRTSDPAPSRLVLFLIRWLLFRLLFLAGLVKFRGGDATWAGLTALRYHYWTQPLPTWTSWYANLAPNWFQALSVCGVFFIEVIVPLLFFAGRRLRLIACALAVFLQLLIAATGNYGFFNLLAIVLCIALLDDAALARLRLAPRRSCDDPSPRSRGFRWPWWITAPLTIIVVTLSLVPSLVRIERLELIPDSLVQMWFSIRQFNTINGYGLFGSMTTERPELIVEGSDDGTQWKAYEFKWKPGDVTRRPRFCTPHMPRLDWQMWFAALDLYQSGQEDPWLILFLQRLREGSPPVLDLLASNPFPGHPPRYVRVRLYAYRFTTWTERRQTGAWWHRDLIGQRPAIGPEHDSRPE